MNSSVKKIKNNSSLRVDEKDESDSIMTCFHFIQLEYWCVAIAINKEVQKPLALQQLWHRKELKRTQLI